MDGQLQLMYHTVSDTVHFISKVLCWQFELLYIMSEHLIKKQALLLNMIVVVWLSWDQYVSTWQPKEKVYCSFRPQSLNYNNIVWQFTALKFISLLNFHEWCIPHIGLWILVTKFMDIWQTVVMTSCNSN